MAYDYSQYGGALVERRDKVLIITLNAPETLNAFTGPMHTIITAAKARRSMNRPANWSSRASSRNAPMRPTRPAIAVCGHV